MTHKIKIALLSSAAAISLLAVQLFASAALTTAIATNVAACTLVFYQPKEPASLKKYCKN